MQFGNAIGTACSSFAITNIDDIFVLVTFMAEASTSHTLTPLKVTIGQYVGFTVIVIVSMIGFGVSIVLPSEPIGFLGLLPILLGLWNMLGFFYPDGDDDDAVQVSTVDGMKSIFKVASVTVMNGGDNIGTYVPLFSQVRGAEIAVYVVVYYILLGLWCLVAFLVMRQKHILKVAQKYANYVVPFLYVGLGIYILVKSDCFPWSIEHINASRGGNLGRMIMAVVTTGLLLLCIGGMWLLRIRKKRASEAVENTDTALEAVSATSNLESIETGATNEETGQVEKEVLATHTLPDDTAQAGASASKQT